MVKFGEFTVDEALALAEQHVKDLEEGVPSVSRTLAAEVRRLTTLLEARRPEHRVLNSPITANPLRRLMEFLLGRAPYDGVWFGDPHSTKKGAFWWREELSAALAQAGERVDETPFAWHVDGPTAHFTCYKHSDIEIAITEHCEETGDDPDDYTATAMYLRPAPTQPAMLAAAPAVQRDDQLLGDVPAMVKAWLAVADLLDEVAPEWTKNELVGREAALAAIRDMAAAPAVVVDEAMVLIAAERRRQVESEGWTPEHDDEHTAGEMASAAAVYAVPHADTDTGVHLRRDIMNLWPWHYKWFKPTPEDRVRELVKAGALIVAEIERLNRAAALKQGVGE